MVDWTQDHVWWIAALSIVMFAGTLVAVPWFVIRIPPDYFARTRSSADPWAHRHPIARGLLRIGKNTLGAFFVLAGIVMLLLPGQGILTMVVGIMLLDFPGKHRLELWFVARPPVLRSINWIRQRGGRPPLVLNLE